MKHHRRHGRLRRAGEYIHGEGRLRGSHHILGGRGNALAIVHPLHLFAIGTGLMPCGEYLPDGGIVLPPPFPNERVHGFAFGRPIVGHCRPSGDRPLQHHEGDLVRMTHRVLDCQRPTLGLTEQHERLECKRLDDSIQI